MKTKTIIVISVLVVVVATIFGVNSVANSKTKSDITNFENVLVLENPQKIYCDSEKPLGLVENFCIIQDSILVVKSDKSDFAFTFVNVNNATIEAEWGIIGQGPNEYPDFDFNFWTSDSILMFGSYNLKTLNFLNVSNILEGDSVKVTSESIPYKRNFRPLTIVPVRDWRIAIGCFDNGSSLGIYHSNGEIIDNVFPMPFECSYIDLPLLQGTVFQKKIALSKNLRTMTVSYNASDIFEIYQINDNNIVKTFTNKFSCIPHASGSDYDYTLSGEGNVRGIFNLKMDDQRICFQYSGKDWDDISDDMTSDEILCFNLMGEKSMKLKLPFMINNFCLNSNSIIVSVLEGEDYVFYRFSM